MYSELPIFEYVILMNFILYMLIIKHSLEIVTEKTVDRYVLTS